MKIILYAKFYELNIYFSILLVLSFQFSLLLINLKGAESNKNKKMIKNLINLT